MRGDTTQSVFPQFIKKKKQIKGASRPSLSLTVPSD